jgi:hypothetical protein
MQELTLHERPLGRNWCVRFRARRFNPPTNLPIQEGFESVNNACRRTAVRLHRIWAGLACRQPLSRILISQQLWLQQSDKSRMTYIQLRYPLVGQGERLVKSGPNRAPY